MTLSSYLDAIGRQVERDLPKILAREQAALDHLIVEYAYTRFSVTACCTCGWTATCRGLDRDKTYLRAQAAADAHRAEVTA